MRTSPTLVYPVLTQAPRSTKHLPPSSRVDISSRRNRRIDVRDAQDAVVCGEVILEGRHLQAGRSRRIDVRVDSKLNFGQLLNITQDAVVLALALVLAFAFTWAQASIVLALVLAFAFPAWAAYTSHGFH